MATVKFRMGSDDPFLVKARQPDGTNPTLAGLQIKIIIHTRTDQIEILPVHIDDDAVEFDLNELYALPDGTYNASVYYKETSLNWRFGDEFLLKIMR